jgi:hypothetical protein
MTMLLARPRAYTAPSPSEGCCCACRVILPLSLMEPVSSRPWLRRCRDEDACRQRFTPRRLAWSVRRLPS